MVADKQVRLSRRKRMDGKSQKAMISAPDADDVQYYGH